MPTVKELRSKLKEKGMKVGGTKDELLERLEVSEPKKEAEPKKEVFVVNINGDFIRSFEDVERAEEFSQRRGHEVVMDDPR